MGTCCTSLKENKEINEINKIKNSFEEKEIDKEKLIDNFKEERLIYYGDEEKEKESMKNKEDEKKDPLNESIEKSIEIDESKFQNKFNMDFGDETEIYNICELSNNRIAILDSKNNKVKIYSLQNFHFLTEIKQDFIKNIIELNNNDLIINSDSKIYFYKLLQNQNYELYQAINEYGKGRHKIRNHNEITADQNDQNDDYKLNSIYQLMNGDLISCNSNGINIYKKRKDNKYELSFTKKIEDITKKYYSSSYKSIEDEIAHAIEIKKNIVILFRVKSETLTSTKYAQIFTIYKYDMNNQNITQLFNHYVDDRDMSRVTSFYFNYFINDNYLFVRFGNVLQIYNMNAEIIYDQYFEKGEKGLLIKELYCDYKDNLFISCNLDENLEKEIVLCYYNNKKIKEIKKLNFVDSETKGVIKLKNNDFIFYTYNKINYIKNLNK